MINTHVCFFNERLYLAHTDNLLRKISAPSARITIWGSSSDKERCAHTKNNRNLVGITGPLFLFLEPSLLLTLFLQLKNFTIRFFHKAIHNPAAFFACCFSYLHHFPIRAFFYESPEYKLTIKSGTNQFNFKLKLDAISYNRQ